MLNALEGVAYVADLDGRLASVGRDNWGSFATYNGGGPLGCSPPLGQRITDGILGPSVRAIYERAHGSAVNGDRSITFTFRCDAPDTERRMKMSIGPLKIGGAIVGALYQATVLSERTRPLIRFLDAAAALEQYRADQSPIVALCSFCAKVSLPGPPPGEWVDPEIYYQRGGVSEVRISHGVCADCVHLMDDIIGD